MLRRLVIAATFLIFTASLASAQGRTAGSLLVYPAIGDVSFFATVVSVTNTALGPLGGNAAAGDTALLFHYMNVEESSANLLRPNGCSVFCRSEYLTPGDTLSVFVGCHNATPIGGRRGYLVITAQEPEAFDVDWSFNALIGSQLTISSTGGVFVSNALPFSSPVAAGNPTDINGNGLVDFDGVEYEQIPDVLYLDNFTGQLGSSLALVAMTGGPLDLQKVQLTVWNDDEFPLSQTFTFNCWFSLPLWFISPMFAGSFLSGLPNDASELDVTCNGVNDVQTGWLQIQSLGVEQPDGTFVAADGAFLGLTYSQDVFTLAGGGGRLLWESVATQGNGVFGVQ